MESTEDEKIIMISNDNSITLTTHRIFQITQESNKEILLKNIISHEVIKKKMDYYKVLTCIFALVTLYFYTEIESNSNSALLGVFWFSMLITIISAFFLFTSFKKSLRITAYFGIIEFSLSELKTESLNDFLSKMYHYAELRKKETK
ncbi:hypothetical protein [Flavobacterium sp. AG291]|uniref:hypothetical protein n=1 Tax=Flavobacterium sp. AG291 TaxID=2184000 RepID=UPI000E0A034F|nr:hypothetical protein [Flavobacterium sp. AG291]RDI11254.1 hypothetical protein DEU42_106188 [Flavobacterium sp. AG291]